MSRFENVSWNVMAGLATIVLLGVIERMTGFFRSFGLDVQLFIIGTLLVALLLLTLWILWIMRQLAFPRKPPLVRSHNEADTFLFHHGQWRKIPDWQTRDYLASVLGFAAGEEDIALKPKDEIDKLRKGPPLESIFTYAKR